MGFKGLKTTEPLGGGNLWSPAGTVGTGGKYCKRYTSPESKKVKRNSKFDFVLGKFVLLNYFLNAFLKGFFYLERVLQH